MDEIWYCLSGQGKVWRMIKGEEEEEVSLQKDVCLAIPVGTHFQFQNTSDESSMFLIATMPPWPGPQDVEDVEDHWIPSK